MTPRKKPAKRSAAELDVYTLRWCARVATNEARELAKLGDKYEDVTLHARAIELSHMAAIYRNRARVLREAGKR